MLRFIDILNDITGQQFRLPTEAEWEFAARGGNKSKGYKYSGSDNVNEVAWYKKNSKNFTKPVKLKKPNELGIYDMSGNVWEVCEDIYDEYPENAQVDPVCSLDKTVKVIRGGSWGNSDKACRTSHRFFADEENDDEGVYYYVSLRLALSQLA